jgi:uncharacterized protein YecE (DUF72 family)
MRRLQGFVKATRLGKRFALEGRRDEWFNLKIREFCESIGITLVSVDAPELPRNIFSCNGMVYLRMHGREFWYTHYYTDEEMKEVAMKIVEAKPKCCYVFFNNDTNMLRNANAMLKILLTLV